MRVIVNRKRAAARPGDRDRQPEGRRRQDHHGDQPRHRARRLRQARPADRPRSAGQCQHRARHPERRSASVTSYDVMLGQAKLGEAVLAHPIPGFELVPAVVDLSAAEIELVERPRREYRAQGRARRPRQGLRLRADRLPALARPADGQRAGRRRASVLVPLQCEFFALEGLSLLLRTVERVRRSLQPAARGPGRGADHVRPPQQPRPAGRDRRAQLPRQAGLRHRDPAQRAGLRGALARPAGDPVRLPLPGLAGLCPARGRGPAPRADAP